LSGLNLGNGIAELSHNCQRKGIRQSAQSDDKIAQRR